MNWSCQDEANLRDILKYANKVNSELLAIKCYYSADKNRVYFGYYFWIEGSKFSPKNMIKALKIFDIALGLAYQKDEHSVLK